MKLEVHDAIDNVPAEQWNVLNRDNNPFLRHEFLAALEHNNCVGPHYGWRPKHIVAWEDGRLIAAVPLYLKENSYGEFVFDFSWADAYQRHGARYYPKLVSAIPYTPASGRRMLLAEGSDERKLVSNLVDKAVTLAGELEASSLHWLFVTAEEYDHLQKSGLAQRVGYQFHWRNLGYVSFEAFLSALTSKRRKNIRRERRLVREAGIRLEILHGPEVSDEQWRLFSHFYAKTFEERFSLATFNEDFFKEVGRILGRQVILVLAHAGHECVAGALLYRGDKTLYGRHWGCARNYDSLHFEVCYYQGIEYCIREGLQRFEPGAQGEHKIWRGFLPTLTYSCHWIAHPGFRAAIGDFLHKEQRALQYYAKTLDQHSPYRSEP